MTLPFADRRAAGDALVEVIIRAVGGEPCTILAIPRGGVIVAAPVALALGAPLGIVVPRKVGAPGRPELALGAVAPGGIRYADRQLIERLGVEPHELEEAVARAETEVLARARRYGEAANLPVRGVAVLVDDGIATGATAIAAARSARARGATRVILAAPVAPSGIAEDLAGEIDEVVVLETPSPFVAVGRWYERFDQTTDDEVVAALRTAG